MVPVSRTLLALAALAALSGFGASAQSVISTHSGVLHVSEGAVFIGDQPVNQKFGTFPEIKESTVLRTEMGRAEVLLTPGVFLRIGENSSIRMIDNRLSDTRVEFLTGKAVVECDDPMKLNAVTILAKDAQIHVRKASVMEFSANPAELKVYHGEAEVEMNGSVMTVKSGRLLPLTQALAQDHFDAKNDGDELTRWSQQRSEAVSVANLSAAKTLRDSGTSWSNSGWYYNPFYSMYTYIPMNGMYYSPYGYGFFSPYTVYQVYVPGYYNYSGGGTSTSFGNRPRVGTVAGVTGNSGQPSFGRNGYSPAYGSTGVVSGSPGMSAAPSGASMGAAASGGARSAGGGRGH
jgi:hypothetical protein